MIKDNFSRSFDRAITQPIVNSNIPYDIFYQPHFDGLDLDELKKYSHMIISGSEASVLDENAWEEKLTTILFHFVENRKKVLGICYGHQFLARALAGKEYTRKSPNPEFGWAKITVQPNPLFEDVPNFVAMVSHNDEVINLPGEFEVIASTPHCPIHAFQYKQLPVWGVQFHPEYGQEEAEEIFEDFFKTKPERKKFFVNELEADNKYPQNGKIIRKFCQPFTRE